MNKTKLASSVATRTSVTRATADSAVAAVFATIAEALARGEKVSIAGFGTFATRSRLARQGRNPATGRASPSPLPRRRRSRPARRSAMRSTGNRGEAPGRSITSQPARASRTSAVVPDRCLWQGRDIPKSAIGHTCEHMRSHAPRLNPLARGFLLWPDANFRLRQSCPRMRMPSTQSDSAPLTAPITQEPKHCILRPARNPRRHLPIGVAMPK